MQYFAAITVIAALVAVAAPAVCAQGAGSSDVGTKADRENLASHAIGINFAFMEVCTTHTVLQAERSSQQD